MCYKRLATCVIASTCLFCSCSKNIDGEQYITEDISVTESSYTEITSEKQDIEIVFPARLPHEVETELVEKAKLIINEKNYFSNDGTEPFYIGVDVPYEIYADEQNYYILYGYALADDGSRPAQADTFTKYDKNLYYIGDSDYTKAEKISSGSFFIDSITKPDYSAGANPKVTHPYNNYADVISSAIKSYSKEYKDLFRVYLLDRFHWDKSEANLPIMIVDNDGYVFITEFTYGGHIDSFGFRFHQNDYPELVEKYKDTAVGFKAHAAEDSSEIEN